MDFIQEFFNKAKNLNKTIVLPESEDPRILKAAELITKSRMAKIILIGSLETLQQKSAAAGADLSISQIIDPKTSDKTAYLANKLFEVNPKKKLLKEDCQKLVFEDPVYFGAMLVADNQADGMVTGADHSTAHTIKATLQCIGTAKDRKIISSFFVMISPITDFGINGLMLYADCGVRPNPSPEELAEIAVETADSFRKLVARTPRIAMLSFSTKGSAKHPDVDKVIQATEILRQKKPDLKVDGELQADAALIPEIGRKKSPDSPVAGRANILIFPDLDAGNIGYKLSQRLGNCIALGPILQGAAKPINDLSRGCSVDDIINVCAITAIQAQ